MDVVEAVLLEQKIFHYNLFRYSISTTCVEHTIEIWNEFNSVSGIKDEISIALRHQGHAVYPDIKLISELHPALGYIFLKNIDKIKIEPYLYNIMLSHKDFKDIIKPRLKVIHIYRQ